MEEKLKKRELWVYTLLFIMLFLPLVAVFFVRGKSFIHSGDPFDQDYPIFLYLGRYLKGILRGEGVHLYEFSIGLGENIIAPLNLYGFGDPLNLFSIFVTTDNGEFLYTFLLFFRLYLTGVGMLGYLKSHGHKGDWRQGAHFYMHFLCFPSCVVFTFTHC